MVHGHVLADGGCARRRFYTLLCAFHATIASPLLSFSARRPRTSVLGMKGALAHRVLDCPSTAGPAEIDACGAEPTTKVPLLVSAGHSVSPSGEPVWSAVSSPGIPCL